MSHVSRHNTYVDVSHIHTYSKVGQTMQSVPAFSLSLWVMSLFTIHMWMSQIYIHTRMYIHTWRVLQLLVSVSESQMWVMFHVLQPRFSVYESRLTIVSHVSRHNTHVDVTHIHTYSKVGQEAAQQHQRALLDKLWRVLRLLVSVVPSSSECPLVLEIYRHQVRCRVS